MTKCTTRRINFVICISFIFHSMWLWKYEHVWQVDRLTDRIVKGETHWKEQYNHTQSKGAFCKAADSIRSTSFNDKKSVRKWWMAFNREIQENGPPFLHTTKRAATTKKQQHRQCRILRVVAEKTTADTENKLKQFKWNVILSWLMDARACSVS